MLRDTIKGTACFCTWMGGCAVWMGNASGLTKDWRWVWKCRLEGTNRSSSYECFEVATAVWLRIPVLWDVAVSPDRRLGRLGGSCLPHLQGTCTWRSVTSQKTGMFKCPSGYFQVRKEGPSLMLQSPCTAVGHLQQCHVLLQEPDIGSAGGSNRSSHYGCRGAGGSSGSSHHSQWVYFDSDWLSLSWYRISSANQAVT